MWRWSLSRIAKETGKSVFSTYVEVIPCEWCFVSNNNSILHVCGGDPHTAWFTTYMPQYSPRMWRWSSSSMDSAFISNVFSTYVEVIPYDASCNSRIYCILHVCGGDPSDSNHEFIQTKYSPRMWRWSPKKRTAEQKAYVFSTYVEVILGFGFSTICKKSILHVCGGDP